MHVYRSECETQTPSRVFEGKCLVLLAIMCVIEMRLLPCRPLLPPYVVTFVHAAAHERRAPLDQLDRFNDGDRAGH